MNMRRGIIGFAVLASMILTGMQSQAGEFKADMVQIEGKRILPAMIFVKDSLYRLEQVKNSEKFVALINRQSGKTRILNPGEKQYMDMKNREVLRLMEDPVLAFEYAASMGEKRLDGTETVGGYECDKYVASMQGEDIMIEWVAKKLDFPIKITTLLEPGRTMELRDISEVDIDDGLFATPEGYTEFIPPHKRPVAVPDWAGNLSAYPESTLPFERNMKAGDVVRVKVLPGQSVWIKGKAIGETEAKATAIPFLAGRPVKDPVMLGNFAQRGVICTRNHETIREADEIVIRVDAGEAAVQAKAGTMIEREVAAGEPFRYPYVSRENIELRLVNASEGISVCTWNYYGGGAPVSDDEAGPAQYRKRTLEEPNQVKNLSLVPKGDELVIQVEQGTMLIKIGQYDSFEF